MDEIEKNRKADTALQTVKEHSQRSGNSNNQDLRLDLIDLMVDLRILAQREGYDHTELDDIAFTHYLAEVEGVG